MRAALATRPGTEAIQPLLDPRGASVVLGEAPPGRVAPLTPAAHTLFGPRGVCLAGPTGPLVVCDTGHHRVLVWTRLPQSDNAPADLVIGQPDFAHEGRNGGGAVGPATLNVPTGVAVADGVLAVADAWNHRVLLWHGLPARSNQPADVVLGQADFASGEANRGLATPRADTLNWCYGVAIHAGRLVVADTGNRRVLAWDEVPRHSGAPADRVLGQADFTCRDENGGASESGAGLRWPHAIVGLGDGLAVADAGHNRVLIWTAVPGSPGLGCDLVLGQSDRAGIAANRGAATPSAASLNQPFGLAVMQGRLIVADTANSRLLGFAAERGHVAGEAEASLAGQLGFDANGENRWGPVRRDTLSWPYGISACDPWLAVADTGNNRVLLWRAA